MKKRVRNSMTCLEELGKRKFRKTLFFTFGMSLASIILAIYIQLTGQGSVNGCSYLDPISVDFLAFLASLFLIIEGLGRIYEHPHASMTRQFTRIIRVSAGFAILTLHIMQFVHK